MTTEKLVRKRKAQYRKLRGAWNGGLIWALAGEKDRKRLTKLLKTLHRDCMAGKYDEDCWWE